MRFLLAHLHTGRIGQMALGVGSKGGTKLTSRREAQRKNGTKKKMPQSNSRMGHPYNVGERLLKACAIINNRCLRF